MFIGLIILIIFMLWFFSHSLTTKQALKNIPINYTEIVASYSVNDDEVFFLKNDEYLYGYIIEKKRFVL